MPRSLVYSLACSLTLGGLSLAPLACSSHEPNEAHERPEPESPPHPGYHPEEPPSFPPIPAAAPECEQCKRNDTGECRYENEGDCPGGPKGTHEACLYEVPCHASCCKRFPINGGVALVRPGKSLWDYGYRRERVEVARVPGSSSGLLVRVMNSYEDEGYVQVRTLGTAPPSACKNTVDDLRGVILWADVAIADLKQAPKRCRDAVYALGNPDDQDYGLDIISGHYKYEFDPANYADARVVKGWTPVHFPWRESDRSGKSAGLVIEHIALPDTEVLAHEHNEVCYRLPGVLQPRVCSDPRAVHKARAEAGDPVHDH